MIRSGAVLIYSEKKEGPSFQVELRRGDFFGEMALLSDLPRNATARVILDATVFCLKKKEFEGLLSGNKDIGLFLSRLYARRLSSGFEKEKGIRKPSFYSVCASDPDLGLSHFLYSMSFHISTESKDRKSVV